MDISDIASLAGVSICAIGLIVTWIKNSHEQTIRDQEQTRTLTIRDNNIKTDLARVQNELESPEYGLRRLSRDMSDFKTHCASMSTALNGRIVNTEKNIDDIKRNLR